MNTLHTRSEPRLVLFTKSHVASYTRKDGAFVAEHEDRRQGKTAHHKAYHATLDHIDKLSGEGVSYRRSNSKANGYFEQDGQVLHQHTTGANVPSSKADALAEMRGKAEADLDKGLADASAKKAKAKDATVARDKSKAVLASLKDAQAKYGDAIDAAHHNRKLQFKKMDDADFMSKDTIVLHQSPSYMGKKGSSYRLVMVDGRPAYARHSDHWGTFGTVERGVYDRPKIEDGDSYHENLGEHWKSHEWTIDGGSGQSTTKKKVYESGYVFLDDLPNNGVLKKSQPFDVPNVVLFLKTHVAGDGQLGGYAHKAGYYLHNGHWHAVSKDKPAPKSAPKAAHPEAAGAHAPAKHLTDDQWSALKLPESNTNAPTYNSQLDKLKEMSEAGHVTGIVGSGYGVNTYGKKLAVVANHLLEKHGSAHKVVPGQKVGEHPAVQGSPVAVAEKDAALQQAIDHLKEDANQSGMPAGEAAEDKALVTKLEAAKAVEAAPSPALMLSQIPWDKMYLPSTNSNAGSNNKKIDQIKKLAEAGDISGLEAMKFGSNTYGKKQALLARAVVAAIKESSPNLAQVDASAHEAATSPHNDAPAPTQAQIEAGNYKKGHIKVSGINIAVENPRGSTRSGVDGDGKPWSRVMSDHYGYIKRTEGADGDQLDVYVGPNVDSKSVFVVDQLNQETGQFDEHKVMLGYNNKEEAVKAYSSNFDEGWRVGPVTELSVPAFKDWVDGKGTQAPLDFAGVQKAADEGPHEGDRNDEGLVFRGGRWHREKEPELSDDPNSPNYRFKDTGYIAGSRKEEVTAMFREASRTGKQLRATSIDWEELENNPRQARSLVTKSNLFGDVDWAALKEDGMKPGAGFLIDRVYASVPQEPSVDSPVARKDYAVALESLRDRLESCKTPEDVTNQLSEIRDEMRGTLLTEEQSAAYKAKMEEYAVKKQQARDATRVLDAYYKAIFAAESDFRSAKHAQDKRIRRGWKPDPELDKQIASAQTELDAAYAAREQYMADHPELVAKTRKLGDGWESSENDLEFAATTIRRDADAMVRAIRRENLANNPLTRAWSTLGSKFEGVLNYRQSNGSNAFAGHVTNAKAGRISDWSWSEKGGEGSVKKATKREVAFQLKVADTYERIGGREVSASSTAQFKQEFGLRDVQSGNWVLNDPNSAAWHVQKSTEALADLADLLGAKDHQVSMKGRLAMAFGARGRGNAGGSAARAHYEPIQRVINLTKLGGGGCLAHEWVHALDNLIVEAETGKPAGVDDFASENPNLLPPGKIRDAFVSIRQAMLDGNEFGSLTLKYTAKDVALAKYNVNSTRPNQIALAIKTAPSIDEAVRAVDKFFGDVESMSPRAKKRVNDWRRIAVAYHHANLSGGEVKVAAGPKMSSFAAEAVALDGASAYWSQPKEMFARAFQSYVEDKLAAKGQKNDYLSAFADNKYYDEKPFPEGNERKRINMAFDSLIAALAENDTLAKAMQ